MLFILGLLGVIASYLDVKTGKIKNKIIVVGLLGGVVGHLLFVTESLLPPGANFIYFFKNFAINIFISWIISFFIWYAGFWSAGDAKIFMLFSFLLPLKYYGNKLFLPFFPAANLLVNAFILVLAFILLENALKIINNSFNFFLKFKVQKINLKKIFFYWSNKLTIIKDKKQRYFKTALVYWCLFLLIYTFKIYMRNKMPVLENFSYIVIILMFLRPLRKFINIVRIRILYFFCALSFFYTFFLVTTLSKKYMIEFVNMFRHFTGFMLIAFFCFRLLEWYINREEEVKIGLNEVVPNTVLSKKSIRKIEKYLKKDGLNEKFYPDGLTSRQIEYIQRLSLKQPDFKEVFIYKTFPLTPFIFLGTVFTIATGGAILDFKMIISAFRTIM